MEGTGEAHMNKREDTPLDDSTLDDILRHLDDMQHTLPNIEQYAVNAKTIMPRLKEHYRSLLFELWRRDRTVMLPYLAWYKKRYPSD